MIEAYKKRCALAVLAVACCLAPAGAFVPSFRAIQPTTSQWTRRATAPCSFTQRARVASPVVLHAFDNEIEYDRFLGELIFSSNDPAYDIANNMDRASNEEFRTWLRAKANACTDLEERVALSSLADIIDGVLEKIGKDAVFEAPIADAEFSTVEEDTDAAAVDSTPQVRRSNEEIFGEMRTLQGVGGSEAQTAANAVEAAAQELIERGSPWESVPAGVRQSYESVLKTLLDRSPETSLTEAVEASYDKCDIQFLALLRERTAAAVAAGDAAEETALLEVAAEVNAAMQRRMTTATLKLQEMLTAGSPGAIEMAAAKLARTGGVDDALVLLLEANIQQAEQAGPQGAGAARLLNKIRDIFRTEKDRTSEPEKRVLRQCLREKDPAVMEEYLKEAFRPRAKLALVGGGESSEEPLVPPPVFINAVRGLKLNFGNVGAEEKEFAEKIENIITVAEKVATELYGESMSPTEQQDRAWREHGTSVWELEKIEEDARMRGEEVPWANDKYDHVLPNLNKGKQQGEFLI